MTHLPVIASEAKQSSLLRRNKKAGLLRRSAPRNDGEERPSLLDDDFADLHDGRDVGVVLDVAHDLLGVRTERLLE